MPHDDADIEQLLLRYHPAPPPMELRDKILSLEPASTPVSFARQWTLYIFRAGIAAMLLFSFGLFRAAEKLNHETISRIGAGAPRWTSEAEDAASFVDAGPAERRYIAICLRAGPGREREQFP